MLYNGVLVIVCICTFVMILRRVLYFGAYLEVMTLLEEQNSGRKDIHGHKLFHRAARSRYVPSECTALSTYTL